MRFFFECFALCKMSVSSDPETGPDEVTAKLLNFFTSREDAAVYVETYNRMALAQHEAQYTVGISGRWLAYPWNDPGYVPALFQTVALKGFNFETLSDAETMIESAAVLQYSGVGLSG